MIDDLLGKARLRLYRVAKHSKGSLQTNRYDTSDIVQNSLLQMWQEIRKVGGVDSFTYNNSYLEKVGRGNATRLRRHHTAQKRAATQDQSLEQDCVDNTAADPHWEVQQEELMTHAIVAASHLQGAQRVIIFGRFVDGKTFEELAQELEIGVHTVRREYQNALLELRRLLSDRHRERS